MKEFFKIYINNNGDRSVGIEPTTHVVCLDTWFGNMLKDEETLQYFKEDLIELFAKYDDEFKYSAQTEEECMYEGAYENASSLSTEELQKQIDCIVGKQNQSELSKNEKICLEVYKEELASRE